METIVVVVVVVVQVEVAPPTSSSSSSPSSATPAKLRMMWVLASRVNLVIARLCCLVCLVLACRSEGVLLCASRLSSC